jgi:uncharacterized membrane protein YtjA (UPF0391 family)
MMPAGPFRQAIGTACAFFLHRGAETEVSPKKSFWGPTEGGHIMLRLALLFLIIALIAGLLGFGLVANLSFEAAKILFIVFIILAVLFFLGGMFRGPAAPPL